MSVYLLSLLLGVLCSIAFILNLAVNEVILSNFPESEGPASIGQFMPWVQVGIGIAGVISFENYSLIHRIFARSKETTSETEGQSSQHFSPLAYIANLLKDTRLAMSKAFHDFLD